MTTVSTYCITQSRRVPSNQPAGRKTTLQIFALSRAMMNINPYQRHAPLNHISRRASTDHSALSRSAWTYQQSRRCRNLAGISGKQTGLSLQKASLKVSIAYHRGVKTTNASANLSSPRPRHIFHEEYENRTSHAGQMKARPYSNSTKRMGIPIPVRSSRRPWKKEDASDVLKKWQNSISHTRSDAHGACYES